MLEIFNRLSPFFEDCYREIGVREFSRLVGVSAPSASLFLKGAERKGFLVSREERRNLLFRLNRENEFLCNLSKLYWQEKLKDLVDYIDEKLSVKTIVLFGSLVKLEVTENSDVDLVVIFNGRGNLNLSKFEKKLGRKIQVFYEKEMSSLPLGLKRNVLNGFVLKGRL